MGCAVAAQALEVHGVLHAPQRPPINCVTRFVGTLVDPESLPAELEHLRHERKRVQRALRIERAKYLLFAPHLDDVADTQIETGIRDGSAHETRPPWGDILMTLPSRR